MQPRILGILECAAASAAQTKLRATKGAQLRLKTYVRRNSRDFLRHMAEVKVRIANLSEAALIGSLNKQLIEDQGHRNPMTVEELTERVSNWITTGEYRIVLLLSASQLEEVVGYATYSESEDEVHLRQFLILPDYRRRGFGSAAFRAMKQQLWPRNSRVRVEALTHNKAALTFWKALGFSDYSLALELHSDSE